jgi:hypothetical protein
MNSVFSEKQAVIQNTGFKDRPANKMGVLVGLIVGMKGYLTFPTVADAMDLAKWEASFKATKSQRSFIFPLADKVEDKSTEDKVEETLQGQKTREEGKMGTRYWLDVDKNLAVALRSFNGKSVQVCPFDESATIQMTTPNRIIRSGLDAKIYVGAQKQAAAGERVLVPVDVYYTEPRQSNEEGCVIEPMNQTNDWNPKTDIDGVYDVNLETSDATVTSCKVTVKKAGIDPAMTIAAVDGLAKEDFVLKTSAGVARTITSLTPTGVSGEYTLVSTIANADTLDLVVCGSITLTTIKIESTGLTTIVVA